MENKALKYFNGNELAANVWQDKYAQEGEETPDDMHRRMAKEFARIEKSFLHDEIETDLRHLSEYGRNREFLIEDKIFELFKDFKYIVPQGSIMSQLGAKSIGSLSNCFVIGQPEDSYGGILLKDQEQVQLMKRRGGVGIDISTLRPNTAPTSNAAKSSTGAVSFMHRFSNSTREVAQNGRRGALMISMDISHPDTLDFIKIKRDLTQVTGANISVKLNNEFMKAVEADEDYILTFPCESTITQEEELTAYNYNELIEVNGKYLKRIKAKEYWDEIIKSAHGVAEPGIMFWDNIVNYSPDGVYEEYRPITTNPCGEIPMQPYDACRLLAINLFSFVDKPFTKDASFNFDKFYKVSYEAMRLSDDIVELELEHIQRILNKIESDPESFAVKEVEHILWKKVYNTARSSRRTGLGFTALGDCLAALGLGYTSPMGLSTFDKIMHTKMKSELNCTIDMAITRGPFEGWNRLKEYDEDGVHQNDFYGFIGKNYKEEVKRMLRYGRRNVSFSTVAPTGTVSLLTQTTSGIEPLFMPYYIRRKKINSSDEGARIDFTDDNGDTWQEFPVLHKKFKDWMEVRGYNDINNYDKLMLQALFEQSPWYGSTANDIDWVERVEIQSIAQKYTSHSISSTVNLPNDVSEEEVSKIYMAAWKKGLKGITVYRDGSRSGVLVSNKDTGKGSFEYKDAVKRPRELVCDVYTSKSGNDKYNIFVGMLEGKPYEIFMTPHFTSESALTLKKIKRGRYDLLKNGETYSEDITTEMSEEQEAITRLCSTSLRHGADIKFIVEQLNKTPSENMFSFVKSLARVLKRYIPDGAKSTIKCNECNSKNVIFEEGCHKCLDCGSSACG